MHSAVPGRMVAASCSSSITRVERIRDSSNRLDSISSSDTRMKRKRMARWKFWIMRWLPLEMRAVLEVQQGRIAVELVQEGTTRQKTAVQQEVER